MYQLHQGTRDLVVCLVPESVRHTLRPKRRREPEVGRPLGLDAELLEGIFEQSTEAEAGAVSHIQISGWKRPSSDTFRVFVDAGADQGGDSRFGGLAAGTGSEFTIYATATDGLSSYLAEAYSLTEIEPGVRYRLVLEDLRAEGGFKVSVSDREVLTAVQGLPGVHRALREWTEQREATLFRYDRRFSSDLREITHRSLERRNEGKPARSVTTLLANWRLLERIHDDNAVFDPRIQNPVHGDANRANVLVPASGAAGR